MTNQQLLLQFDDIESIMQCLVLDTKVLVSWLLKDII